ncbi:MAG: deoxyguanosinetriphosphate triphosphohydrolase [Pseudomonadota bacterium]
MNTSVLASFASNPSDTKGRLYPEIATPYRNEFQRDKDRIIHSNAFRRLEYKTQVFVNHEGDHYRNRLTHSIEVASVARSLAGALNVSEDLAECVALAHDLGHTPFGHAGEEALNECMKEYGGFCHNAHAIKLLTTLEKRYAAYNGLNLTWEVLDGIAKHNGPLTGNIPEAIVQYDIVHPLELNQFSSMEAQIAATADDIAYHGHDLEDGIRAGMFDLQDLAELDFMDKYVNIVRKEFPEANRNIIIYEAIRHLTHSLINDLLAESRGNIEKHKIRSSLDVRQLGTSLIAFSEEGNSKMASIKSFLFRKVYRNHRVAVVSFKCKHVVTKLFELYMNNHQCMPPEWQERIAQGKSPKPRIIADYIAGMTDRYAIKEFQLFYNITFGNF